MLHHVFEHLLPLLHFPLSGVVLHDNCEGANGRRELAVASSLVGHHHLEQLFGLVDEVAAEQRHQRGVARPHVRRDAKVGHLLQNVEGFEPVLVLGSGVQKRVVRDRVGVLTRHCPPHVLHGARGALEVPLVPQGLDSRRHHFLVWLDEFVLAPAIHLEGCVVVAQFRVPGHNRRQGLRGKVFKPPLLRGFHLDEQPLGMLHFAHLRARRNRRSEGELVVGHLLFAHLDEYLHRALTFPSLRKEAHEVVGTPGADFAEGPSVPHHVEPRIPPSDGFPGTQLFHALYRNRVAVCESPMPFLGTEFLDAVNPRRHHREPRRGRLHRGLLPGARFDELWLGAMRDEAAAWRALHLPLPGLAL
mmetsp:Transcript_30237/g.69177  ORF Transcript_30237/g.69177 Transcript_30237/m.69177 type:complete len:359 (+) Transcript_30237:747-1823(+)